eukprot:1897512-Rhodomonas_salina.2
MEGVFSKTFEDPMVYRQACRSPVLAKYVRIRDRTLGLYYGLAFAIISVYIVGWYVSFPPSESPSELCSLS